MFAQRRPQHLHLPTDSAQWVVAKLNNWELEDTVIVIDTVWYNVKGDTVINGYKYSKVYYSEDSNYYSTNQKLHLFLRMDSTRQRSYVKYHDTIIDTNREYILYDLKDNGDHTFLITNNFNGNITEERVSCYNSWSIDYYNNFDECTDEPFPYSHDTNMIYRCDCSNQDSTRSLDSITMVIYFRDVQLSCRNFYYYNELMISLPESYYPFIFHQTFGNMFHPFYMELKNKNDLYSTQLLNFCNNENEEFIETGICPASYRFNLVGISESPVPKAPVTITGNIVSNETNKPLNLQIFSLDGKNIHQSRLENSFDLKSLEKHQSQILIIHVIDAEGIPWSKKVFIE